MNPILSKVLLGVSLASGASAISFGGYKLFSSKTIKDKLMEKMDPLDVEGNDEIWKQLKNKLVSQNESSDRQKMGLKEKNGDSRVEDEDLKDLKTKCRELFNKTFAKEEDEDYINASHWCTKKSTKLTTNNVTT